MLCEHWLVLLSFVPASLRLRTNPLQMLRKLKVAGAVTPSLPVCAENLGVTALVGTP